VSEALGTAGLESAGSDPWPSGARFDDAGLSVAKVAAADLARRFGTPLLVVDEDDFRARCRAFRAAFPRVLFAVKAFPAHELIRIAVAEGLGLLVATGGELEGCLRAGVPAAAIAMHGNNKSLQELELAVATAIDVLVADNAEELERLDAVARRAERSMPVLLRVSPGVSGHTHRYVDTGGSESKFGTQIQGGRALEAAKLAWSLPSLEFRGLHAHVGSQLLDASTFLAEADAMLDLAVDIREQAGMDVRVIDLGGGFGAMYTDEAPPAPRDIAAPLLERVREGAAARGLAEPEIVVEPGRALVANAVLTLYRVGSMKSTPSGRTLAAVDGGMSDNVRPALYGARYTLALADRSSTADAVPVTVVGKHCESGDIVAEDVLLPADISRGDMLAVATTGAYTYSMASTYNRVGRPAVVAVRDREARLLLRREDASDLDRLEVSAPQEPDPEPPEGVVVRPARPGDAASYLKMWTAVVAERRWVRTETVRFTVRGYRRLFRRPVTAEHARFVAVAWGNVVGNLVIERLAHPVNRHVATLGMAVDAAWRGRGIGSALMSAALRWARSEGLEKVSLEVYPGNVAAIALYRKFGFVEEGRLHRQSRKSYGYEDEVLMSRWLAPPAEDGDRPQP
jgi:diaminopimelate decarboxylase